jgi:thymidine kinase
VRISKIVNFLKSIFKLIKISVVFFKKMLPHLPDKHKFNNKKSYFTIFSGCMFSGKTTLLDGILDYNEKTFGLNIFKITHSHDLKRKRTNLYNIQNNYFEELNETTEIPERIDIIGIDEGQFFSKNIINFVKKQLSIGKNVILCTLNADYKLQIFGYCFDLLPICNNMKILTARCVKCGGEAYFTQRISTDTTQIVINDSIYEPVCREHHTIQ